MKRFVPLLLGITGIAIIVALMPRFNAAQPRGARLTRYEATKLADEAARQIGVPVESAWSSIVWDGSDHFSKEVENDPQRRRRAESDPVVGPRLGYYDIAYFRRGKEKWKPYSHVQISAQTGQVLGARAYMMPEERGASATEAVLRPRADAFVRSRVFPGAPSPQFEQARPTVESHRTDWVFRYRVTPQSSYGTVVPYLNVYFNGDQFGGWGLVEEYADGHEFRESNGADVALTFARFIVMFVAIVVLLVIFLKKYHAGEVGVGTGSLLFGGAFALSLALLITIAASASRGTGMGNIDAQQTAWATAGFITLFIHLPLAVLVFFGWSVGESYARERWGHRLASFDALLRRNALNATVGRSLLSGILLGPAIAAAAFLFGLIPLALNLAHTTLGNGTIDILYLGGALATPLSSAHDAILFPVVALLFILAWSSRRRALPIGIIVSIVLASLVANTMQAPIEPGTWRVVFGAGGVAALVAVFMTTDLLTTVVAEFCASLLIAAMPLASVAQGALRQQVLLTSLVPIFAIAAFAVVALMTKREVVYSYEDLAPHVKRIVERERVKAEIDAANRIQAALLPFESPKLEGASVASHYRAATEIGGDYFDFLPQENGDIGIAFGDVSGHGLTSGIVMAMAKAALLVQIDYDPSPCAVMRVLNEIVIKTAPRRILMTFFFGLLDPRTHTLRFSSAGHLDPYVFRAETRTVEPLSVWGFPLGVRRREPFRELSVEFEPGDRLVLYSDGLIEAIDDDGEPFGFDRFEKTIIDAGHLGAEDIKKSILNSVRKFTHNRPPEDDQTLVVVSFEALAAPAWRAPEAVEEVVVN